MRLARASDAMASDHAWREVISVRTLGRAQKTLLIVDDHARPRCAMSKILREAGFAVLEANNGAEGLRLAEHHAPDGILLDLAIPGRSGLEVLKQLKRRDPSRDIRVVFAGAYALVVLGDLSLAADDRLQKPLDLPDLLAKVLRVVSDTPTAAGTGPNSARLHPERGNATPEAGERVPLY